MKRSKFPGSRRSRNRARQKLTTQEIRSGTWLVTGGELGDGDQAERLLPHRVGAGVL